MRKRDKYQAKAARMGFRRGRDHGAPGRNGEQPLFLAATLSGQLIALPFVSSPATAQARAVTATGRPAEKVVRLPLARQGKCDIRAHVSDGITGANFVRDRIMRWMRKCRRCVLTVFVDAYTVNLFII